MGPVLVLVERNGSVPRSTCALLTLARRWGSPVAVLFGAPDAETIDTLGRFGASEVLAVPAPDGYPAAAAVETLTQLARGRTPSMILISSTPAGQEIAARLAVRLDSGLITDAIDIRTGDTGPVVVQSVLAGAFIAESTVVRGIPIITVRTDAVAIEEAPTKPAVRTLRIAFPASVRAVQVTTRAPLRAGQRPDLTTADIVVAGGHGLGSRGSFDLVGLVADALGGAVAGSHTAAELGWCPRSARVDQTGTIVHPRLYFALGISGSVRHRAGMHTAATVIAIDRDPAAPIFGLADLGVVGDVHEVVPELLAEIKRRKVLTNCEVTEEL